MDAIKALKEVKGKIDSRLEAFLEEKTRKAGKVSPDAEEVMKHIKEYALRGGKRLRPAFMVYGFKCLSQANEEAILGASICLELMHAFLLIHDDIMDEDEMRRGGPSLHKIYRDYSLKKFPQYNAKRFGENVGIIAGDVLAAFGAEAILNAGFPQALKNKAFNKYNQMVYFTSVGQLLDLYNEVRKEVTEANVLKVHELKTSRYTVEGPLHLGVILANGGEKDLRIMTDYGIPLGQAFQIQDDVLGMFGKKEKLGKPVDSDLREGKKTLLILKALKQANAEQKEKILSCLGNRNLSHEQANEVRQIIKATGAYDYSKALAEKLVNQAKKAMEQSHFRSEGKEFLLGIAEYLLQRDY